jgi:hypothetical protein
MGLTRSPPSTFIHHFGSLLVGLGVATNTILPVFAMFLLSQTACSSSRHPPRTLESVPLVKSLGAGFLTSVAIHPYPASLRVGTSADSLNYFKSGRSVSLLDFNFKLQL